MGTLNVLSERGWLVPALLFGCAGCGAGGSSQAVRETPRPSEAPAPSPTPTPTTQEASCPLVMRVASERGDDGTLELVATLHNATERDHASTLQVPCPRGPVAFEGLPAGYDVGQRCLAGACPGGSTAPFVLALAAGEARQIARVRVHPAGDACNAPLPAGRYPVRAHLSAGGLDVCSPASTLVVQTGDLGQPASPAPTTPDSPVTRRPRPLSPRPPRQAPPQDPAPAPTQRDRERCPAVACAYEPCPPGVTPPAGCAGRCGCAGMEPRTNPLSPTTTTKP